VDLHNDESANDMSTPRPSITELPVADILVPKVRLRVMSEAKVLALMDLISEVGFFGRISVRHNSKASTLMDGLHRLEAMKRLNRATIPVEAYDCNQAEADRREVVGNLLAGMKPLQDAIFLAAWQEQQEKLHPELRRGAAGALAKHGVQTSFKTVAEAVAEARQVKPRQVQRIIQAARQLKSHEREGLQRAECALPLSELLLIGKLADGEERASVIRKLSLGAAKSVGAARSAYRAEIGASPPPVLEEKDAKLQALIAAWGRAGAKMQRAFVEMHRTDLERLLGAAEGDA
jgi:ParB family transcriptional regulator, chromosome partitioning protein